MRPSDDPRRRARRAVATLVAAAAAFLCLLLPGPGSRPEPRSARAALPPFTSTLDRELAAATCCEGGDFDPIKLIAPGNTLLHKPKEGVIAQLRAFRSAERRRGGDAHELFLFLRLLFDLPPGVGKFPPMLVGAPDWTPGPASEPLLPRFPLAVEADLPLLLVSGYSLAGKAEDPSAHIDWYEKHGVLRTAPLRPPDDPTSAADALVKRIPELRGPDGAHRRAMIRLQVVRAVRDFMPPGTVAEPEIRKLHPGKDWDAEVVWTVLAKRIAGTVVWAPERRDYVRR